MKTVNKAFRMLKAYLQHIISKRKIGVALLFIVFFSYLYHNDTCYSYFEKKINPTLIQLLGLDPLKGLNHKLHAVDIVGKFKQLAHPLSEKDYIDLAINEKSQAILEGCLAKTPLKKKWVPVYLTIDGKIHSAKLKFHGTNIAHYIGGKFSYALKLPKDSSFVERARRFRLIKGEEINPPVIACNQMAHSLGLISPYGKMKIVRINGKIKGDYYFVEDIKKEFLERKFGISHYSIISNTNDRSRKEFFHATDHDLFVGHIAGKKDPDFPRALHQFQRLGDYIEKQNVEEVKKMFDVAYMAKYLALASLFNDNHFLTGDNLKLVYDHSRGKFYPIYRAEFAYKELKSIHPSTFQNFNNLLFISNGKEYIDCPTSRLFKLLLSDNYLRFLRDKTLFKLLHKNDFLSKIENTHARNEAVMLHSGRSRREYDRQKKKQITAVQTLIDQAAKYIHYAHIYGTFDPTKKELTLLFDSFSPLHLSGTDSTLNLRQVRGIEFNAQLSAHHSYKTITLPQADFHPRNLIFINEITQDTLRQHIYINRIHSGDTPSKKSSIQQLKDNGIAYALKGNVLRILPGVYSIRSNVTISPHYLMEIPAGVILKIAQNTHFMVKGSVRIRGSRERMVQITNIADQAPFGSFSIVGSSASCFAEIDFLKVSGGSEGHYEGRFFSGQFAIYHSNVTLRHSTFEGSQGDDGLNIKYSKVEIDSCIFSSNHSDQLDLDFCFATVKNSTFLAPLKGDRNGDGLDINGSCAQLYNCRFQSFKDKGLSVGEKSKSMVSGCHFSKNKNAIAAKDEAKIFLWNNQFHGNEIDISSFVKKRIYGTPMVCLAETKNQKLKMANELKINLRKVNINDCLFESSRFQQALPAYRLGSSLF
jgi:hypothetical protein